MDLSAFDLKGKVALVTGGAHGIGFSIAEGMAKCGATVCFNCSNEGSLEKGLAAYKAAGIDAHGYAARWPVLRPAGNQSRPFLRPWMNMVPSSASPV